MNPTQHHDTRRATRPRAVAIAQITTVALSAMLTTSSGADMYHLSPRPGGVPAQSTITSVTPAGTNTTVCWYGMQGWYSVEAQAIGDTNWTSVGRTAASDHAWCLTVTNGPSSNYVFRLNQNNAYVGSGACGGCHLDQYSGWRGTPHSYCFSNSFLYGPGMATLCFPCHTVGYGQPTGFTDTTNTPQLENVGCENCHGPAAWHKYSDHDLIHPAVTMASEICGGCHSGYYHGAYDEWTNAAHAVVTPHVATYFTTPPPGFPPDAMQPYCGVCHSGATRHAMLMNYEDMMAGNTNYLTLPSAHDAATYGQTCATCHDPHGTDNPAELRNPIASTNFFTLFPGYAMASVYNTNFLGVITTNKYFVNTPFASQYDPTVQICAQCHNSRGARWQDTGRPPHHAAQYNILIGAVQTNYLNGATSMPGIYGLNTNGCAQCHVHFVNAPGHASATNANYTGHQFVPRLEGFVAAGWYADTNAAAADIASIQTATTNYISALVGMLNNWGLTNAPGVLRTNYAQYSWEYSTAGDLSNPTGTNTWLTPYGTNAVITGPSSARQSSVPDIIKQARFDLYMVFHDLSLGVHNTNYVQYLLNDSSNKVWQASQ